MLLVLAHERDPELGGTAFKNIIAQCPRRLQVRHLALPPSHPPRPTDPLYRRTAPSSLSNTLPTCAVFAHLSIQRGCYDPLHGPAAHSWHQQDRKPSRGCACKPSCKQATHSTESETQLVFASVVASQQGHCIVAWHDDRFSVTMRGVSRRSIPSIAKAGVCGTSRTCTHVLRHFERVICLC